MTIAQIRLKSEPQNRFLRNRVAVPGVLRVCNLLPRTFLQMAGSEWTWRLMTSAMPNLSLKSPSMTMLKRRSRGLGFEPLPTVDNWSDVPWETSHCYGLEQVLRRRRMYWNQKLFDYSLFAGTVWNARWRKQIGRVPFLLFYFFFSFSFFLSFFFFFLTVLLLCHDVVLLVFVLMPLPTPWAHTDCWGQTHKNYVILSTLLFSSSTMLVLFPSSSSSSSPNSSSTLSSSSFLFQVLLLQIPHLYSNCCKISKSWYWPQKIDENNQTSYLDWARKKSLLIQIQFYTSLFSFARMGKILNFTNTDSSDLHSFFQLLLESRLCEWHIVGNLSDPERDENHSRC